MGNDPSAGFIAIIVILILALVMRWVFRPSRTRVVTRPVDAAESANLGLLTVIGSGLPRAEAMQYRGVLGEAGIRASTSKRRDGNFDVLVFQGDADKARILLGP